MVGRILVATVIAFAGLGSARADGPSADLARTAWAVSDLVLDKHINPPTRQEMLLYATRAALHGNGVAPPSDLSRRVSAIASQSDYATFLGDLLGKRTPKPETTEQLVRGLVWPVVGNAHLLSPRQYRLHEQVANNRYEGTGIQVRMHAKESLVEVMSAFPGGPARRAGMKAGDLIEAVDDVACQGKTLQQVVEMIQGAAGVPVSVVVRQAGASEKRTLKMVREVVPFERVTGYRRTGETAWQYRPDPKEPIAFLRIRSLSSSVVNELRRLEKKLQDDGVKAVVLDLRFSFDSDTHQAALIADALLDGGVLWRIADNRGGVEERKADRDCLFRGLPLIVLVNEHTQGTGTDLIAAALQDAGRAQIVGEPTGGDGLVKTYHELPGGLGHLYLATGSVVRAATKHTPKEEVEPIARGQTPLWRVRPNVVVPGRDQSQKAEEWYRAQETPESAEKGGEPPADPQLDKARELLRRELAQGAREG